MEDLVNECRTERMGADALEVVLAVKMTADHRTYRSSVSWYADECGNRRRRRIRSGSKGKELYYTRVGQLDMACSKLPRGQLRHVMIRADHLSQGQINGFPTYRLKNAKLNSIHGRFKGCMKNIRATPFAKKVAMSSKHLSFI